MLHYDEVVQQDNVVFETAENATLPEFSKAVRTCLADLPVNKNFLIESITIADFETLARTDGGRLGSFKELSHFGDVDALAKAVYRDDLFGKRVEVCVMEKATHFADFPGESSVQFALPGDDVLYATIASDGNVRTISGMNADTTLYVKIDAYDFSEDEFEQFLNNAWSDSAAVIYPQLRKSLCVLPKKAAGRDFAAFTLSRVDESYAEAKGYANWAIPRVGHWIASGYFLQDDEQVEVSFFDMDYEHNAQQIQELVATDRKRSIISNTNHPATINGTDAWWYVTNFAKEISFSIKSFRVCVDADYDSSLNEDELNAFASELMVWEQ